MTQGFHEVLVSAHRCGSGSFPSTNENSLEAMEASIVAGVDLVEFDVWSHLGQFVIAHDSPQQDPDEEMLDLESVLSALAGRALGHIDIKCERAQSGEHYDRWDNVRLAQEPEVRIAELAMDMLGPRSFILTSLEDESIRILDEWRRRDPARLGVKLGLSLGRDLSEVPRSRRLRTRLSELFPSSRFTRCGADLVVANKTLARWSLLRFAQRSGLPVLVWTVDEPAEQKRFLSDPRVWAITTNKPVEALALRKGIDRSTSDKRH